MFGKEDAASALWDTVARAAAPGLEGPDAVVLPGGASADGVVVLGGSAGAEALSHHVVWGADGVRGLWHGRTAAAAGGSPGRWDLIDGAAWTAKAAGGFAGAVRGIVMVTGKAGKLSAAQAGKAFAEAGGFWAGGAPTDVDAGAAAFAKLIEQGKVAVQGVAKASDIGAAVKKMK